MKRENDKARGLSGAIWNALGSTMYGLTTMLMIMVVNRMTDVATAGVFGIAYTTAQMLFVLGVFGANHLQMTDYSHAYSFSVYKRLKIFSCAAMFPCALGAYALGLGGESLLCLLALTLLMALNAFAELYQSLFFQHKRLDLTGKSLFYRMLLTNIGFVAALAISGGELIVSVAAACIVNAAATWYFSVRPARGFLYEARDSMGIKELTRACLPLFASVFLMNLMLSMPKYGIELVMDSTAQGYFNLIFVPVQVINLCAQFVFKPMLSRYAELLKGERAKGFLGAFGKQCVLLGAFTLVCCAGAFLLGPAVLGFVYGTDLSHVRMELTVLIAGSGIFALCQLMYYILVILRKNASILVIYLIGVAAGALLCALLVPVFGMMGAAVSFALSHVVLALCYFVCIARCIYGKRGNRE